MALSFAGSTKILMPGPLTTSHSSVDDCSGCHANVAAGQFGWLHSFIKASTPAKDSAACLTCHKIGDSPTKPHGLSTEDLPAPAKQPGAQRASVDATVMERIREYLLPIDKIAKKEVFCATCHKEHRSHKIDIKSMPDNRCQTCHAVQFKQFDKDHPEFKAYPFARRTRIKFNHASHIDTHFPDWKIKKKTRNGVPDTCAGCHTSAGDKRHMGVKPFRQICASCHVDQIVGKERASGPRGVALFALPGIDLGTIKENGLTVGEWPSESEAELTPLMKLLLGGSAARRKLLAKVEKLDLLDLTKASAEEIRAVVRLSWEIKRLLHSLKATQISEVLKGLERSTGLNIDQSLMTKLIATLPRDVLVNAQRDWLPNLQREVEQLHKVGWKIATGNKRIGAAKAKKIKSKPAAVVDRKRLDRLSTNPKLGRWIVNAVGDLVQEGDTQNAAASPTNGDDKSKAVDDNDRSSDVAAKSSLVRDGQARSAVSAEAWAEFGGWYRKDFAILYKPTGHADPFMRAWLDLSANAIGSKGKDLARPVFSILSDKSAQGQCIKCHSVDAVANQSRQIQWGSSSVKDKSWQFTKFVHEPHFRLLDDRGCLTCHKMGRVEDFEKTYQDLDPASTKSNFKQVEKKVCATCHKKNAARQDCLLCHDYHVAPINTPITSTKLPQRK